MTIEVLPKCRVILEAAESLPCETLALEVEIISASFCAPSDRELRLQGHHCAAFHFMHIDCPD